MFKLLKKVWNSIMKLFKISDNAAIDVDNVVVDGKKISLKIQKVTALEYDRLVYEGKYDESTLYIVETDNLDAQNKTIENVGYPMQGTDGASKQYVDDKCAEIKAYVDQQFVKVSEG